MSILNQKTIKKSVKFAGIGLHSGKKVEMILLPAQPNTGIIFKRSDLKNNNLVYTSIFNVSKSSYCTKLSNDHGVTVSTVEHLMAALYGLGIDNLLVELNSEELPILDGSAKNIVEKTIKFLEQTEPEFVSVSGFLPVPGSPIAKNPEKYGISKIENDWSKYGHLLFRFSDDEEVGLPFEYSENGPFGRGLSQNEIKQNLTDLQGWLKERKMTY